MIALLRRIGSGGNSNGLPVRASHTRTELLDDDVTIRVPSGLNCTLRTPLSCPEGAAGVSPVAALAWPRLSVRLNAMSAFVNFSRFVFITFIQFFTFQS